MQRPRRFAPTPVRFTPDQLSSLDRNDCPVSPEYALAEESGIPYQSLINLYLRDCAVGNKKLHLQWAN